MRRRWATSRQLKMDQYPVSRPACPRDYGSWRSPPPAFPRGAGRALPAGRCLGGGQRGTRGRVGPMTSTKAVDVETSSSSEARDSGARGDRPAPPAEAIDIATGVTELHD